MAAKDLFTETQWQTVGRAPFMTGVFIVSSDLSDAVGIVRELLTVEALVAEEAAKPQGLALARDISSAVDDGTLSTNVGALNNEPATRRRALDSVTAAVRLVEENDPAEATAYRAWLLQIGHKVAEATREGRVLGFARRVSENEKRALAELELALHTTA